MLWHTKKYIKIYWRYDKNSYNFDSFTLDGYCCVGCCHFLIWQSKGKKISQVLQVLKMLAAHQLKITELAKTFTKVMFW